MENVGLWLVDHLMELQILRRAIAEQLETIQRLEADRDAAEAKADTAALDEAEHRVFQAYDYLEELRDDLESLARRPSTLRDAAAHDELESTTPPNGLAIVIGHSPTGDMGASGLTPPMPATARDGKSEYYWNKDLAELIRADLDAKGVRCEIFHREKSEGPGIREAYRQVRAMVPQATVELHFNADRTGTAEGTETLYQFDDSSDWARALQDGMVALFGHAGKRSARGARLDRGLKRAGEIGRGKLNLTQVNPSALIEPFFGTNKTDATRGVSRKGELAKAIAGAFAAYTGSATRPAPAPVPTPGPAPDSSPNLVTLWDRLRVAYGSAKIEFPHLKPISFAQWGLESGRASSLLAKKHRNFGGLKYRDFLSDVAKPIKYKGANFCEFKDFAGFFQGYWRRFDQIKAYDGWRDHAKTGEEFITFIADIYAPSDENKEYLNRVKSVYARLHAKGDLPDPTDSAPQPNDPAQPTRDLVARLRDTSRANAHFLALVERYMATPIEFPNLRELTVAQWGLESDWGNSRLAEVHYNFAGVEWSEIMAGLATPIDYQRGDGSVSKFCRFASLESFIDGYWGRLAKDERFKGWRAHASDPHDFMHHLGPVWRPADAKYAEKVLKIQDRITSAAAARPAPAPIGRVDTGGFVFRLRRTHTERRRGRRHHRTVGAYEVFFNNQKIDGLEGACIETWGPGDNSSRGVRKERRVVAKTYPLLTHSGSKTLPDANGDPTVAYKTHDYTDDARVRMPSMPSLRLGETGRRTGILLHPGSGFLWSVGCFNLSKPLNGPNSNIDYKDSRSRIIAIIEAMEDRLGGKFPAQNNRLIPGAEMIIEGEPVAESLETVSIESAFAGEMDPNLVSDEEAFEMVAATMDGEGPGPIADFSRFGRLIERRSDLLGLRGNRGQNLWFEWAGGWEASFALNDAAERARVQSDLGKIADRLTAEGLSINDRAGLFTPLTAAAAFNESQAVHALHERGALLDLHDKQGNTPLTAAAFTGASAAVETLVASGADRQARTNPGEKLESGAGGGSVELPIWDEEHGENCPPDASALECAKAGKEVSGDPDRAAEFDRIITRLGSG